MVKNVAIRLPQFDHYQCDLFSKLYACCDSEERAPLSSAELKQLGSVGVTVDGASVIEAELLGDA